MSSPSRLHPRRVLRKRRKFTSRSTLALSALPAAAVVDAVVIAVVIVAVAVAAVEDAAGLMATVLPPSSMLMTSLLSLRSHDQPDRC